MATALMYGRAVEHLFRKRVDWAGDAIKVMLVSSAYTPNQDTHQWKSDVTGEISGTGYTAGGGAQGTLANKTLTYSDATNQLTLKADNVAWPNSTIQARYAVIYDDSGATENAKPLLGYIDFGANQQSSAGTFEIVWNAQGIFQVTVA